MNIESLEDSTLPVPDGLILLSPAIPLFDSAKGSDVGGNRLFAAEPVKVERGKASHYYGRWIGRLTASGETYRRQDVTAAHKSLPFGFYVRVHNLANDRSMVVRINNRGPFVRGRVIDLSVRAAEHLEMRKAGVVPVRIEVLDPVADKEAIAQYVREEQFGTEF